MSAYGPPPTGYPAVQVPGGRPPQNYLVWAILSTVCCCLPLGIVSIVFAAQVNAKWAMGDLAGAEASSKKALWFALASVILGVLYLIVIAALMGPALIEGFQQGFEQGYSSAAT